MQPSRLCFLFVALCFVAAFDAAPKAGSLGRYNAYGPLTVSGISAGAYAAVQFHVAFSSQVRGAGIIAGGPFFCANDNAETALNACMSKPSEINIAELIQVTKNTEATGTIDYLSYLHDSRVWLFSGTQDTVVLPGVMQKLLTYYQAFVPAQNITTVFNISAEHAFITANYGNACNFFGAPYINNCGFDAAGSIFQTLYGVLNDPINAVAENMMTFDQHEFTELWLTEESGLDETAYVYVPTKCQTQAGCSVHVALHGCYQTYAQLGDVFIQNAGYNQWAEANGIIVIYPQAHTTVLNPRGCFDWWGYTGTDYASKLGIQNSAFSQMAVRVAQSS
eukprot:TRINITY_DN15707_c0_g1_i1.p1 TRINITY_DN15707_c0_g1~~TRINITY_DN15707_c0_g1_i1.p1  ORF type:complete len:335 (+),score=43.73 TRINITY_DN15707_c0_g1_i1:51-1055(+)